MEPMTEFVELNSSEWALVQRVLAGVDVVLTRDGRRVARIAPVSAEESTKPLPPKPLRVPGLLEHSVGPEPEGAFDPLSEKDLALWYADVAPELK